MRGSLKETKEIKVLVEAKPEPRRSMRVSRPAKDRFASGTSDPILASYLRDIGQFDLITPKQEIELYKLMSKGGAAGKKARETMINANLRLVVKIAKDYDSYGLPLLDLINEGNIGLMKAVERFNPAKGGKISTYGSWWIKQAIKRALASQAKTIRLPVHVIDRIARIRKAEARLVDMLKREPSITELVDESKETAKWVKFYRDNITMISLDAPVDDNFQDGTIGGSIPDENAVDPSVGTVSSSQHRIVAGLLKNLEPREAEIIRKRFGWGGEDIKTLEQLGEEHKLTRERIRQIQNIALSKLRRMMSRAEKGIIEVAE